jgi:phenylalanine-4-hydroxylase
MERTNYEWVIAALPVHLRSFCVNQRYADYTAEHQLTWRFIIDRLDAFLSAHAHPAVTAGFRRFAIDPDHIPHIDEINAGLAEVGWCAVLVDGFLPPVIFMEFQAHRVLPISADMRSLDHVVYTPAPDIVHEAAGHAPMLADAEYGEFLMRVGECGARTLWNEADDAVYQAVRALSIAKEHPNADVAEVDAAARALDQAIVDQRAQPASEATLLARLHWWTVEYGLIGPLDAPQIFGAGLASSLLESRHCLARDTLRLPLSSACIEEAYDITDVQPHYYVARDWQQLNDVLDQLASGCAFSIGGLAGVQRAIEHGTCATAEYANGLQVTGRFERALVDQRGELAYIGTGGSSELAVAGKALDGHDGIGHPDGIGAPVGALAATRIQLDRASPGELESLGISCGRSVELRFDSNVVVAGRVVALERAGAWNVLLHLDDCRVTAPDGTVLFQPDWGRYHMAMGGPIVSVFGGPGDRGRLLLDTSMRDRPVRYSRSQLHAEDLYQRLRDGGDLNAVYQELCRLVGDKWLMLMEIYQAAVVREAPGNRGKRDKHCELAAAVRAELLELRKVSAEQRFLIDEGFLRVETQLAATA